MAHIAKSLCLIAFGLFSLKAEGATIPCGGNFNQFVKGLKSEAISMGHSAANVDRFFRTAAIDKKVLRLDRSQGVFRQDFTTFSNRAVSKSRLVNGARNAKKYAGTFARAERQYGVNRAVILAFWALETDYGAVQGNFNTLNALVTLSHDCRRPSLFRPQIFAAIKLWEKGDFDPAKSKGAWAGELGMIQMLPRDVLLRGVDGDNDGHVRLKTSAPDAIMSAAHMLQSHGWKKGQPWMIEVVVPKNLNWEKTGFYRKSRVSDWTKAGVRPRYGKFPKSATPASILLPQGRKGPAFMVFPNFDVFFEWNKSSVYVTTAAYFSTRLAGAPRVTTGNPDTAFSDRQMISLQKRLKARGHDVGKVDGILGAKTRAAVQAEQKRLGLPADAWPTKRLLNAL